MVSCGLKISIIIDFFGRVYSAECIRPSVVMKPTDEFVSETSLLNDPNTGSPANVEASNLYKDNRKEYIKRVRETVEKSWEGDDE